MKKKSSIAKTILNYKSTLEGIIIPDLKLSYRAMKTTKYWHKNRHADQGNLIEDTDINSHTYEHMIFDKVARNIQRNKKDLQQMVLV